ncbi:MAG: large extracellular alpha-helical protein, partial [Nitrospinaceae bacterium]|nr:large extracellular alpha-helical protein [Nitrospinaceae bacterium]
PPPMDGYRLIVKDPMGKKVLETKDIALSEFGAYDGEFTVPKNGAVGWYRFVLKSNFSKFTWNPLKVLVSDFTPSPFRVSNELNGKLFQPGEKITVNTMARMHAGGPYTDAATRVTARLTRKTFRSRDPVARKFTFHKGYASAQSTRVFNKTGKVDDRGNLFHSFEITNQKILYGTLMVESAVRDDRGKFVASATSAKFVGLDRFVGLKNTHWLYKEDEPAKIHYIVVNERGTPVGGTEVNIQIERKVTTATRVKGAGNAYLTQFTEKWVAAGNCAGTPGTKPSTCRFTPEEPGSYRMTAGIKDTRGRAHVAEIHAWVIGKGRVMWSQENDNALQIIPEAENYKVGDTARYLVKNPFPGAQALVTIERFGVIDRWVQTLETSTPVIEFPVKADYVPGYYLSVVAISPRVDKPLGEGNVDLGKPTFRMGYVSVPVKDPYKEIVVTARPEKQVYRPRDTVKVSLQAKPRHPGKSEPIELAVAVLDESVFDLIQGGSSYFDPYKGFYRLDTLDLGNFNLLTGLVGRQKFEKKGANPGGGGDDAGVAMRSLFKFVSYWNPSIQTDAAGRAEIEFEVPDNLTGWRVLVIAVTPGDRMGLGEGNFKVNRATEVRPVMPNQVTEGDDFVAGFSVMNRTGGPRDITVTIRAEGDMKGDAAGKKETVSLKPYKRTTVWMPVQTRAVKKDRNRPQGKVNFKVTAVD